MVVDSHSFKDGETSFGIFYPRGYVVAAYRDDLTAERGASALRNAGFKPDAVMVVSGEDVLARHRDFHADLGLAGRFQQFVSRHLGNEAERLDEQIHLAEQGHAFVLAYAPDDAETDRAADALRPLQPVVLRKYDAFTMTDLA